MAVTSTSSDVGSKSLSASCDNQYELIGAIISGCDTVAPPSAELQITDEASHALIKTLVSS
jgi:hypothetical protein